MSSMPVATVTSLGGLTAQRLAPLSGALLAATACGLAISYQQTSLLVLSSVSIAIAGLSFTRPAGALLLWMAGFALFPESVGVPLGEDFVFPATLLFTDVLLVTLLVARRASGRPPMPVAIRAGSALLVAGVTLSLAANHGAGNLMWATQLLLFVPVAFIVGRTLRREETGALLRWVTLAGCLLAPLALGQLVLQANPYDWLPGAPPPGPALERGDYVRASLGFGVPLALGSFLALAFAAALLRRSYASAAMIAVGVLATLSRGPIVAILVACLAFALTGLSWRGRAALLLTVVTLFTVPGEFTGFVRGFFVESVALESAGRSEAAGNTLGRIRLLTAGSSAVAASPLTGYGLGTAGAGTAEYVQHDARRISDIANQYLALALEAGVVALAGFIWLLAALALRLRRRPEVGLLAAQAVVWAGVSLVASLPLFFLLAGALWSEEHGGDGHQEKARVP